MTGPLREAGIEQVQILTFHDPAALLRLGLVRLADLARRSSITTGLATAVAGK